MKLASLQIQSSPTFLFQNVLGDATGRTECIVTYNINILLQIFLLNVE
jgi:hypothetical protein